jgi:hypothetical protein
MTHYATKSASHAWRKARQVASDKGLHLNPWRIHDYDVSNMGMGVVLVTYQTMRDEDESYTWYLVRSIPAVDDCDLPPL